MIIKKLISFLFVLPIALLSSCGSSKENSIVSESTPLAYTITWMNYDGVILEVDTGVKEGTVPTYDGATPMRPDDDTYTYTWSGWDPEVVPATANQTYTATYSYEKIKIEYIINFDLNGGTSASYDGSKTVEAFSKDVFFFDCVKEGWNFRGWSYNGTKIFDEKGNQLANPTMAKEMTFVAIYVQTAKLTIVTNLEGAGTITGEGEYSYNSYVDVSAKTNRGYLFIGWYEYASGTLLSNQETYKYMMWSEDVTLEARFKYDTYIMQVKSAHPLLGSVMIKGDVTYQEQSTKQFDYLSSVTISAYTKTEEYRFLGWFNESGNLVETNAVYTFTMPYNDYNLYARWSVPSFNVNIIKNYDNGGTVTGSGSYEYNSSVTINVTTNEGYTYDGIYQNGIKITSDDSYTFNMPFETVSLTVKWDTITYSITYNLDGGTNSSSNPSTYNAESSFALSNPTKTGYTFNGWFDNSGNQIMQISKGTTGNLVFTAHWSANQNVLTVTSEDTSKGTVAITSGSGYSDELITVVATPVGDCVFKGWYHDDLKVSGDEIYTFTMPYNDYSLVAHFSTKEEESWAKEHGVIPVLSEDGKTITYGLYPQTNVSDLSLISALDELTVTESNGWYFYNDEYFAKVSATPNSSGYAFDNGTIIVNGTTYWFKCEPIVWNVLSNNNEEYYMLSSILLDNSCYYHSTSSRTIEDKKIYANNYEYSDIRTWLNNDFYNSAFTLGNTYIQTTTVNNSASTTDSSSNSYACNNTQDKVFLPSYQDYTNSSFGFSTSGSYSETRYCKTTDWARARGAYCADSTYLYSGNYWTRSPFNSHYAWRILNGELASSDVVRSSSVRPAITIKFS